MRIRGDGDPISRQVWSSHEHADESTRSTPDLTEPIRIEMRTIGELRAWAVAGSDPAFADPEYLTLVAEHLAGLFHRLELVRGATATAVEDERRRIAMDVHDSVTQRMYSVSFLADALVHLAGDDPSAAHRRRPARPRAGPVVARRAPHPALRIAAAGVRRTGPRRTDRPTRRQHRLTEASPTSRPASNRHPPCRPT